MNQSIYGNIKARRTKNVTVLLLTCALLLSACGGNKQKTGEADRLQSEAKEFIWVPEYLQVDDENMNFGDMKVCGDRIYYLNYTWDAEKQISTQAIASILIADGSRGEDIVISRSGAGVEDTQEYAERNLNWFMPDKDGGLLTVECAYHWNEASDTGTREYYFCRRDAKGEILSEQDLTDKLGDDEDSYLQGAAVDGEGRCYLVMEGGKFHLLDAQDNYCGVITTGGGNEWINSFGTGRDGKVYITQYERSADGYGLALKELDFEKKQVGEVYTNFPNSYNSYSLATGIEHDFLVNDGRSLYGYDLESRSSEKILDWLDSDINGEYITCMSALEDGRIMVFIRDWNADSAELAMLTKKNASEVPQKENLTLGTFYLGQDLQAAVVNFNKKSDKWHISVRTYYSDEPAENEEDYQKIYQDAVMRLNSDLTSDNCPDLISLGQINEARYAEKGVFEDLNQYLAKSDKIHREDYFENVLEACTYNGTLVGIPRTFSLRTIAGKASELGDRPGWTMEEMMDYVDAHPGAEPFDYGTKDSILQTMLVYNQTAYVDWASGKCNFDSNEFVRLLEFANKFPKEYVWNGDDEPTPLKLQSGEVLLYQAEFHDFITIQMPRAMFDEDVNFIGYPNDRGESGAYLYVYPDSCIGITSKSAHKDGAWAFLEDYLSVDDDESNRYIYAFFANKKLFEQAKEEAVTVQYLEDENGEPVLDEEGNPIEIGGVGSWGWGSWDYELHRTTQEEVDILMELLQSAKPAGSSDLEVMNIILEEAASYFEGQKSAKDVAGVIQNRVQTYLNENS